MTLNWKTLNFLMNWYEHNLLFVCLFLFQGHLMDIIECHQVLLDVVYIVVETSIMWWVSGVLL